MSWIHDFEVAGFGSAFKWNESYLVESTVQNVSYKKRFIRSSLNLDSQFKILFLNIWMKRLRLVG